MFPRINHAPGQPRAYYRLDRRTVSAQPQPRILPAGSAFDGEAISAYQYTLWDRENLLRVLDSEDAGGVFVFEILQESAGSAA